MNEFKRVIKKLPHSECRVPYTYHHDYLRMNVNKFKGASRSNVSAIHNENELELYAVTLTKLLDELKPTDTFNLTKADITICWKAIDITKNIVLRYNN